MYIFVCLNVGVYVQVYMIGVLFYIFLFLCVIVWVIIIGEMYSSQELRSFIGVIIKLENQRIDWSNILRYRCMYVQDNVFKSYRILMDLI